MLKVGITGGIGSGKTMVCHVFESLGVPIYYADDRAKWLMSHDADLIKGIISLFGDKAYLGNGTLNRKHISEIAFKDKTILSTLNALVHPAVAADVSRWFQSQNAFAYAIEEAALLIESQSYLNLDKLIVVTAPLETRISRVIQRDATTRELSTERVKSQMPEEEKISFADYIIKNDGTQLLLPQVISVHRELTELSGHH